jgi:hypothetical protein
MCVGVCGEFEGNLIYLFSAFTMAGSNGVTNNLPVLESRMTSAYFTHKAEFISGWAGSDGNVSKFTTGATETDRRATTPSRDLYAVNGRSPTLNRLHLSMNPGEIDKTVYGMSYACRGCLSKIGNRKYYLWENEYIHEYWKYGTGHEPTSPSNEGGGTTSGVVNDTGSWNFGASPIVAPYFAGAIIPEIDLHSTTPFPGRVVPDPDHDFGFGVILGMYLQVADGDGVVTKIANVPNATGHAYIWFGYAGTVDGLPTHLWCRA